MGFVAWPDKMTRPQHLVSGIAGAFNNACCIATQSSRAARINLAVRVTSGAIFFTPIEGGAALKIGGCDDGGCGERERGDWPVLQ